MKDRITGFIKLIFILAAVAALAFTSVNGIGAENKFSAKHIKQGLDLAGGVSITYEATKEDPTEQEMSSARYKLQTRADYYSTESSVFQEGKNRITCEIPGAANADEILEALGNPGALYFIDCGGDKNIVYDFETQEWQLTKTMEEIIANGDLILTGSDLTQAAPYQDNAQYTGLIEYGVELRLNVEGTEKFAAATSRLVGEKIAIVFDDKVVSAPKVNQAITGGVASITGSRSMEDATEFATILNIGALPIELKEIRSTIVGAQLGEEALNKALFAGAVGFIILALFMIIYYRVPGLAATLALLIYAGLMIFFMDLFDFTLTLQGIAGIVLSLGMAVDANVIIFERIREELAIGMTVRSAFKNGFHKALSSIVDGNVTTLIAGFVLFALASGGVKGFATTLSLGIIISMFSSIGVTKFVLYALYEIGFEKEIFYGLTKERKSIDFLKHGRKFLIAPAVIVFAGILALIINGVRGKQVLNFGLDFKGGTSISVTMPDEYTQSLNKELEKLVYDTLSTTGEITKVSGENTYFIKTMELDPVDREKLSDALMQKYSIDSTHISSENISGRVSSEMRNDAIKAVIVSLICMLIYIRLRFKNLNFAISAVLALLHDVLIVFTVYAVFRINVGNNFIACMLTIVGYSINDTIVIFDRIRERISGMDRKKDTMYDTVNTAITQTLSRTINTSVTTFIMVLSLVIFGGDSIREFAIPLMVGVICGSYSSVCLSGNFFRFFEKKFPKKEEAEVDIVKAQINNKYKNTKH